MRSLGYEEVFRSCNPTARKYTWSNGITQTRIDQIWVSNRIKEALEKSDIDDMSLVTGSDHNLLWGSISTNSFLDLSPKNRSKANIKEIPKRRIYLYQEAFEENWENYKSSLNNILRERAPESDKSFLLVQENRAKAEEFINEE
jgi:transposase